MRLSVAYLVACLGVAYCDAQIVNPTNGHAYYVSSVPVTVSLGRQVASLVGGHVVTVGDEAEDLWIESTFSSSLPVWIGLSDEQTEGVFVWDNGEPLIYQGWAPGEPGGTSAEFTDFVLFGDASGWRDTGSTPRTQWRVLVEVDGLLTSGVLGLACQISGNAVELSWTNSENYDSVEIYRDAIMIATLPGDTQSYEDADPQVPAETYSVVGRVNGAPSFPQHCLAQLYRFRLTDVALQDDTMGQVRSMTDNLSTSLHSDGFSYGVCHDTAVLQLLDVVDSPLLGGDVVFFGSLAVVPGGYISAVVYFPFGIPAQLPPGSGYELQTATYQALVPAPTTTTISYCDSLGTPPVPIAMVVGGASMTPLLQSAEVQIVDFGFVRGDCNADSLLDVADLSFLAEYLFGAGFIPNCIAACDINDDAMTDVADFVFGASYLFSDGPTPSPPFPNCGVGPPPKALPCGGVCP